MCSKGKPEHDLRLLLIEDDLALANATQVFLQTHGFVVDCAATLHAARLVLPLAQWTAVLLDLHLPDGDGLSLLPTVHRVAPQSAVIILTARDQISDRIRGLDAGADDYLVKPFDPDELLARLRAVERRLAGASGSAVITLGQLSIDLARGRVLAQQVPVELTAREWALLRHMASRPERIHTREVLCDALYGFDAEIGSNTVEVFISGLRRKLGRNCIQTLRGLGYRLAGEVS